MAFPLIIVGAIIFVTALQGTTVELGRLLAQDVFGGFIWWAAAILAIGALGYFKQIRPLSDSFLVLVVLVLFVHNRGFFEKITEAINEIKSQAQQGSQSANASLGTLPTIATSGGLA